MIRCYFYELLRRLCDKSDKILAQYFGVAVKILVLRCFTYIQVCYSSIYGFISNLQLSFLQLRNFFSILVFFRNIYDSLSGRLFLSPLHHLHPLHKHLDTQTLRLGRAINAESLPLLAAGLEPGTFSFQAQVLKLIFKIFLSNNFLE